MNLPSTTEFLTGLGRSWAWPMKDLECRKAVFETAADLRRVYSFVPRFRTVIQAGGNCGVWPWVLSKKFARVITAEPDPMVAPYLDYNVREPNVTKIQAAFSNAPGMIEMVYPDAGNLGAQYIRSGGEIPAIRIDDLNVFDCDLIYLDIEGAELMALRGAILTMETSHPVIAVEDKGLSARFGTERGAIDKWLEPFGYKPAVRIKRDTIFTWSP